LSSSEAAASASPFFGEAGYRGDQGGDSAKSAKIFQHFYVPFPPFLLHFPKENLKLRLFITTLIFSKASSVLICSHTYFTFAFYF
jgi:hypothetical protein